MIGFHVRYGADTCFAIDEIRSIGAPDATDRTGTRLRTVTRRDGFTFRMNEYEAEALLKRPLQLLPAEPKTALLTLNVAETGVRSVIRTTIIAWAHCLDGEIRPVTPAGVDDGCKEPDDGWFVEMPDGAVRSANSWSSWCGFDGVAEWLSHMGNLDLGTDEVPHP